MHLRSMLFPLLLLALALSPAALADEAPGQIVTAQDQVMSPLFVFAVESPNLVVDPIPASSCTEGQIRVTPLGLCCPQVHHELYGREQCINGQWEPHPEEPFQCAYSYPNCSGGCTDPWFCT